MSLIVKLIIGAIVIAVLALLIIRPHKPSVETDPSTFLVFGAVGGDYGGMSSTQSDRAFPSISGSSVYGFGSAPDGVTVPSLSYGSNTSGITATYRIAQLYKEVMYFNDENVVLIDSSRSAPQLVYYFAKPVTGTIVLQRSDSGVAPVTVNTQTVNNVTSIMFKTGQTGV